MQELLAFIALFAALSVALKINFFITLPLLGLLQVT
jgi:hypothetical protein